VIKLLSFTFVFFSTMSMLCICGRIPRLFDQDRSNSFGPVVVPLCCCGEVSNRPPRLCPIVYKLLRSLNLLKRQPTRRGKKRCKSRPLTSLGLVNACSVNKRHEAVSAHLLNFKLDLLAITETWQTSDDDSRLKLACPDGFSFIHTPRIGSVGGGVALLFKSTVALLLSPADDLDSLLLQYNDGASVLDKHAPVRTKSFPIRLAIPWFDDSVRLLHREARHAERTLRSRELRAFYSADWLGVDVLYVWYCNCVRDYYSALKVGKKHYLSALIVECGSDQKKLFRLINNLMGKDGDPPFPDHSSKCELANDFLKFFSDKVVTIGSSLDSVGKVLPPSTSSDPVFLKSGSVDNCLASFSPISPDEVTALIS
jgi:hypothetical protein